MRCCTIALLGLGLLGLAGCSSCGCHSWFGKLTSRGHSEVIMAAPSAEGCGCGSTSALPDGEPILSAPQKLNTDVKKDAGFAEPMPFVPKKN